MRIELKLPLGKKAVVDLGFKEPDFITSDEVKKYSAKEQLSPKLRSIHKRLKYNSRRFGITELYVNNLTNEDIALLERKGFMVRMRTKKFKGEVVARMNHWKVSVKL